MRSSCYPAAHIVLGLVWSGWRGRRTSTTAAGSCSTYRTFTITGRRSARQTPTVHAVVWMVEVVCPVVVRCCGAVLGEAGSAFERFAASRLVFVVRVVFLVLETQTFCLVHKRSLFLLTQHPVNYTNRESSKLKFPTIRRQNCTSLSSVPKKLDLHAVHLRN